ncbi:19586_t:CDS:1, partial [Rhizophagus irregularis]
TVEDIFPIVIDRKLTANNLEATIKSARQDLQEIKIDLYRKDFAQDNPALVSTVNSSKERQGVLIDPQKKISQYFSEADALPVYLPVDGKKGPVNIIIYPEVVLKKEPDDIGL